MNYSKDIFVKDYFEIHKFYKNQYGNKVIILMQVGSFHECYGTNVDGLGEDLFKVGEYLNVLVTKKNKNKELSRSNPRMIGFPIYTIDDWVEKLIKIDYTVIVIDQTTTPPNPKREITGIYSPTTYLEKNSNYSESKSTNLICIYIDALRIKSLKVQKIPLLCIGMACYDLTTGDGCVYQTVSNDNDYMYALDDAIRWLENYPPCEVILDFSKNLSKYIENNNKINNLSLNEIIAYLNLNENNHKLYKIHNLEKLVNISYQKTLIDKVFKSSQINCIEELGLQYYNQALLALSSLLDYTINHQPILVYKLNKPVYYSNKEKLFLGNKSLEQLDVLPEKNKPISLFEVIDFTKTILGKRYLKSILSNPYANEEKINFNYNLISKLLELNISKDIGEFLSDICDLNKLNRRLKLEKIHPFELYNIYLSIQKILELVDYIENYKELNEMLNYKKENINLLRLFIEYIENTFDLDYISNLNFINYKDESFNFIKNKKYTKISELEEGIKIGDNFMVLLMNEFTKIIESCGEKRFMKKDNSSLVILKYNDQSGHYFTVTKIRGKKLKEGLLKSNGIKLGNQKIDIDNLEFIDMPRSSTTKIFCKEMKKISSNVVDLKSQLANEIKNIFYEEIKIIINNYSESLEYFTNKISFLDFINSGALCAEKLGYSRPQIVNYSNSFIDVENIRHPIVEAINEDICYQPHNLSLGKDINGILLYGINSSGKSTLMKAIGLNIILAQIGYYTASTKFHYYPYNNLFTRIVGTDNIFRGMSSFMVEMVELMSILKRNDKNTLVLGDEICRGTEEKSANIIVAYMLETLQESKSTFITATHLHMISELPTVQKLERVKAMHLKVNYDDQNETLIYSRELVDGQGDKYYGVQVAKYLMKNDNFNKRTKELELEFEKINVKQSTYNKKNWKDCCAICESKNNLETHHINFQKDCKSNLVIDKPHIKKNNNYNLVTLCTSCHDKVDVDLIVIDGWLDTTDGRKLDYHFNDKKSNNKKYKNIDIDVINKFKGKTLKEAKMLLKNNKIEISTNTISKIWNNKY